MYGLICYPNIKNEVNAVLKIPTENQKERELVSTLKLLSPGTYLREGIDLIIQSNTGGLIVVGDTPEILNLTEGGFRINCPYTPTRLSELAKMDGAIILSSDLKRIVRANVTLQLNTSIFSNETGLRHRAAEKFSKDTGHIVLAVSRRRNTLTLYSAEQHYLFRERPILISGANQTMLALTQYAKYMQNAIASLNWAELSGTTTLTNIINTIQVCERVRRTEYELNRYRIELGTEAQSLQLTPPDLSVEIESALLIIKDYYRDEELHENQVFEEIFELNADDLSEESNISTALGYPSNINNFDEILVPRGYRMLSQIPRIPMDIVENIVERLKTLDVIITSSIETLKGIKDVGKTRATVIKEALVQMKTGTTQPQVFALPIYDWE